MRDPVIVQMENDFDEWYYTGRELYRKITYVLSEPKYCRHGYVVLGLKKVSEKELLKNLDLIAYHTK